MSTSNRPTEKSTENQRSQGNQACGVTSGRDRAATGDSDRTLGFLGIFGFEGAVR